MSKINILDSSIFNRIAAGEVVENPRSVIKELIENSIDAQADSITIEIRGGGIEYISVTDNGKGIDANDMPIAFMPHATSKIGSIKDLEAITTLGFRGEALPSIASVSDVEMISRTGESDLGYRIVLKNGKIDEQGVCGTPYGTKVVVRNLFAHVPARAKFLRKIAMEESDVTEFVGKIILTNPLLRVKYSADGKVLLQSDGTGIQSAVYNVYGAAFLRNMAEISVNVPGIQLSGLIGKPEFTKHNRTFQTLIVNGRYVINTDISYCIQQCYQNYLMKRQFPVYILYLSLPTDMVDVNVHPSKLDVRFAAEKQLKGFLYNAIKTKVDELAANPINSFAVVSEVSATATPESTTPDVTPMQSAPEVISLPFLRSTHTVSPTYISESTLHKTYISTRLNDLAASQTKQSAVEQANEIPENNFMQQVALPSTVQTPVQYVGKLFNTYLFAESGDNLYIIDQHAAHEKLLYDRLIRQADKKERILQDLLIPYIFDVTPTEKIALTDALSLINACGFKIDPLNGNTFTLYALPIICADMNLESFISLLLENLESADKNSVFIKEKLMQAACKSAVKGEDNLSEAEIEYLISQLHNAHTTKFCPHGRPIIIQYSKYDLEKLFKRI